MAGTFTAQNKVRPGAYVNVVGDGVVSDASNAGTLLLFSNEQLDWGATGAITLTASSDFKKLLGTGLTDPKLAALNEALKEAETVKFVNLNSNLNVGDKAQATAGPFEVTAKYSGARGNDITVSIEADAGDNTKATVKTLLDTEVVAEDYVVWSSLADYTGNDYIDVKSKSKSDISASNFTTASVKLTGGKTTLADLSSTMTDALNNQEFAVATTGGIKAESNAHSYLVQGIKRLRETEGLKVRGVVPFSSLPANYEGISQVANGYVLGDGTTISATLAAARFAGMSANADEVTSLTYANVDDAVAASPKLDDEETKKALTAGKIVFTTRRGGSVVVEQDINSLTSFSSKKPNSWAKNRVVRVMDTVAQYCEDTFENSFIGTQTNNAAGRDLFKANIASYLAAEESEGAIEHFDPSTDITVEQGADKDSVVVSLTITPTDSMEKLYMTITVK
ncbi:phage tail sheath family protein [Lactobacillus delbrueckii subsp. bulgaricus]